MNQHRQTDFLGCFINRIVVTVAHEDIQQRHLDGNDAGLCAEATNLRSRCHGVMRRDHHGKLIPRIDGQEFICKNSLKAAASANASLGLGNAASLPA